MDNWLSLYTKAVVFATAVHDGQRRRYLNTPYVLHPLRVSQKILELTGNLQLATAGVLHDVIEDTNVTYKQLTTEFNEPIAVLVESVTKRKDLPRKQKNCEYLNRFNTANTNTVILKLADRFDNLIDAVNAPPDFKDRYAKETIELVEAIPKSTMSDHVVSILMKDVAAWTITGKIEKP